MRRCTINYGPPSSLAVVLQFMNSCGPLCPLFVESTNTEFTGFDFPSTAWAFTKKRDGAPRGENVISRAECSIPYVL